MKQQKQAFYGNEAKEIYHFFIYDNDDGLPVHIENIGYTPPPKASP